MYAHSQIWKPSYNKQTTAGFCSPRTLTQQDDISFFPSFFCLPHYFPYSFIQATKKLHRNAHMHTR